jgi:hypothetical protein
MKLHWPSVPHGKIILLGVLVVVFGGMVFGVVRHHGSLQPDFIVRSSEVHPAPTIRSALVVSGVQAPTGIIATATVGDKRLFVLEQAGDIRILEANGVLDPTPFLDIRSKVQFNGELHYAYQNKGKLVPTLALKTPYNITAFGQGSDGELYFADYKTGSIYHLEDAAE